MRVTRGGGPVVLALPHAATWLPSDAAARLAEGGRLLADTSWHAEALLADLLPDATMVRAAAHRYLIDCDLDPAAPDGACPVEDLDGRRIWHAGDEPAAAEAEARCMAWHAPYHEAIAVEMAQARAAHGVAILVDFQTLRSAPLRFDGSLPGLSFGTMDGESCAPAVEAAVLACCRAATGYSYAENGPVKGGLTIRRHGRPQDGLHAVQVMVAQSAYLAEEAPPWALDPERTRRLRPHLRHILETLAALAPELRQPE